LDNIKGSYANRTVRTFHDELQPFFQLVSNLFRLLDPEQYQLYRQQMDRLANTQADLATYLQESPCPFLGLALVRHLRVTPHIDEGDAKQGYVCMTNTGQHNKCDLVIGTVDQQYRLAYEPGAIDLFRSAIVIHGITDNANNRTMLELFLHNNAMKWNPVPA
jgi:hypothetical protein